MWHRPRFWMEDANHRVLLVVNWTDVGVKDGILAPSFPPSFALRKDCQLLWMSGDYTSDRRMQVIIDLESRLTHSNRTKVATEQDYMFHDLHTHTPNAYSVEIESCEPSQRSLLIGLCESGLDRTVSADGIHSLVAGFPFSSGWHPDASQAQAGVSSNRLPSPFSILMKPVPVYTPQPLIMRMFI